jgi:hypothetical protein
LDKSSGFCNYTHTNIQVIAKAKYIVPLPAKAVITPWKGTAHGYIRPSYFPAPFLSLDAKEPHHYELTSITMTVWQKMHKVNESNSRK